MQTEFKRVKHGEQPGDVHRSAKIAMREKKTPIRIFPWQSLDDACAKSFRKYLQEKSKKVQRRRDKRAIEDSIQNS